jgi:hypothetical protein
MYKNSLTRDSDSDNQIRDIRFSLFSLISKKIGFCTPLYLDFLRSGELILQIKTNICSQ